LVNLIFKNRQGESFPVQAEPDYSVMEAAYNNDVPGILAECGGAAACGTCHIYVKTEDKHKLEPVGDNEDAMLFMVEQRHANSRLSCQLKITEEMEGMEFYVAGNG
jgi:2Fe-2S ferredoxin